MCRTVLAECQKRITKWHFAVKWTHATEFPKQVSRLEYLLALQDFNLKKKKKEKLSRLGSNTYHHY